MANKSIFSLSDFKAAIKSNGVARSTRFELLIHPPAGIYDNINSREISIRCNSGSLPPLKIHTKDYLVGQGQMRKMPVNFDHGNSLDYTFYNDIRGEVYTGLLAWAAASTSTPIANDHTIDYYTSYTGSVIVTQLDEQDNVRYGYHLMEAYPILVEAIAFNSDEVNTAQLVKVTFAYRYAKSLDEINQEEVAVSEYLQRIRSVDSTQFIKSQRVNAHASSTDSIPYLTMSAHPQAEVPDQSMVNMVQRTVAHARTPEQIYVDCMSLTQATREKGNGIYDYLQLWQSSANTRMSDALATGNQSTIQSAWGTTQAEYNSLTANSNTFFSDSANSVSYYNQISNSIPANDVLHQELRDLKTTYNNVAVGQTNAGAMYNSFDQAVARSNTLITVL